MDIRTGNLSTQTVLEKIRKFASRDASKGIIRAVYTRDGNRNWNLLMANCSVMQAPNKKIREIYGSHAFITKGLAKFDPDGLLQKICGSGVKVEPGFPNIKSSREKMNWEEEIVPSHLTDLGYPVRRYSTKVCDKAYFKDAQLVAYDMPYYPSAKTVVETFLGLKPFHGDSDGRKGEFAVEVYDKRAAIVVKNGKVGFKGNRGYLLIGQINDEEPISLGHGETRAIEVENVRSLELWLVSKDDEIIDYRTTSGWPHSFQISGGKAEKDEALKNLVISGESEICEFKPYIDLNSSKNKEIEKTVCAFSNHKGGTLFIGIDDEGEVIGLKRGLANNTKWPEDSALDQYEQAVKKRLKERLKNNQCFLIEQAEIYGEEILVIRVSFSADLNEILNPEEAYIRRGATSKKMRPAEIMAYRNKNSLFSEHI